MPVVGNYAYVLADTGQTKDANDFTPDHKTLVINFVDSAISYEFPNEVTDVSLVIRNTLHISSMKKNLIPNFMIREAGIKVNDTPKTQVEDTS